MYCPIRSLSVSLVEFSQQGVPFALYPVLPFLFLLLPISFPPQPDGVCCEFRLRNCFSNPRSIKKDDTFFFARPFLLPCSDFMGMLLFLTYSFLLPARCCLLPAGFVLDALCVRFPVSRRDRSISVFSHAGAGPIS